MIPVVVIESPYAGDVKANRAYAIEAMRDSLMRGEAPIVSHLFYTEALDDTIPTERSIGMKAGFALATNAQKTVVYTDRGISAGMKIGIEEAEMMDRPIEYRSLA